ncbi:hypothetical protein JNL27_13075 [bacterium]|nr:hypothetical protein [bacterium]
MKNQYKRQDIFRCTHDAHGQRGHYVSTFHTMHRKGCFPDGCTYFRWKCHELEHRRKCYRGYSHVGKNCPGCKYFDEEKFTRSLVKADENGYNVFLDELHDFEEWLRDAENKEHWFLGTIRSVKPHIRKTIYGNVDHPKTEHTNLLGYLICFEEAFIGNQRFDDFVYGVAGREFQSRLKFRQGDRVEFRGTLTMREGRLVFQQFKKITFMEKKEGACWTDSESLVARSTGTTLTKQAEKCISCDQGMLIDVVEKHNGEEKVYHRIFCLKGMPSAAACTYDGSKEIYGNTCSNQFSNLEK